jgi:DNA polymerase-3 subunit epsilon
MKLSRPLIFLDIEATGADASRDRIVEIALVKNRPDGKREEKIIRINPGIKISAEVVAVHGITNEEVANAPAFKDVAISLLDFMEGCDFAGFGVARFDIPILVEEFKRSGFPFPKGEPAILDALTIFHRKEPRDLTAAYQFYCHKKLVGAHGARADTLASEEVLLAQLARYPDLPQDVPGLHDYCHKQDERYVDGRGKFIWKDGEAAMNFGKYKGELLRKLVKDQRDYVEWVINEGKFPQEVVDICWKALRGEFPIKQNGPDTLQSGSSARLVADGSSGPH